MKTVCRALAVVSFVCRLVGPYPSVAGSDWPQWRGPDGTGVSPETDWPVAALDGAPRVLWRANVGQGYSGVSIAEGLAVTMGNTGDEDVVAAFDSVTGAERWRQTYPCKAGSYPGPRAAPWIGGQRVITLGRDGTILCLNLADGAIAWRREVSRAFPGAGRPRWGYASSPVVHDGKLLLNVGEHGVALDVDTGRTVWDSEAGTGGYAAVVPAELGGRETLLVFSAKALVGVAPATGRALWRYPWETRHDVNAADPEVIGNRVFISSGYDRGCALLDAGGQGQPREIWENTTLRAHFSSVVVHDNLIYGVDGQAGRGELVCLDPASGEVRWRGDTGFGSLIRAGARLIVLNEQGMVRVIEASGKAYRVLAESDPVLGGRCWTPPSLSHARLYVRDSKGDMACLALGDGTP